MDAQSQAFASSGPETCRTMIDRADLRCILSNLSQELCRPLESLRVGFDLLLVESPEGFKCEQRGHVQTMAELCDEMLSLTRSYLDYAGLVHGTRPLNFGTFTISAMIREVDREFAEVASKAKIGWECVVLGPDATVTTDASHCQQILGNLASNALKYTGEGGNVRVVGLFEGDHWLIKVSDNGPGIPAEYLGHVFEPFFRLPRDGRSTAQGSGLGLAICREMVQQLGGSIKLTYADSGGIEATVRFPVAMIE